MLMVASYSVNSSFVINYLVFAVFMDPNVTLHVIDSWMISIPGLIPQYPLSLLVTSIWFLIAPLIAQALICPTLPVRALPLCGIFLRPAVSSMFGGICISRLQAIPGPGRMGVLLPVLILLMFLIFGCLLSCAMIPFRVLFLTIAAFSSVTVPDVTPPGPGLWKLNTPILQDEEYVQLITDSWLLWRTSIPCFPSLAKWWEEGKSLIKGLTIRFCCDRSATRSSLLCAC